MASQVEICNMALSHIGAKTITLLADSSESARKCTIFWTPALEATLRGHDWSFAGQEQTLALIADETIQGFDYLYAYPSSCLYLRKVYSEETDLTTTETEDYKLTLSPDTNVKAIATNVEDAIAYFTRPITDTTMFDSAFVLALSYQLAALLAKPLTGDMNIATAMAAMAKVKMDEARVTNKAEVKEDLIPASRYADIRGS